MIPAGGTPSMRIARLVFPVVVCLLSMPAVHGQLDQGQIAGTIQDSSLAAVGKATITAVSVQGGVRTTESGENGSYILTNMPVGMYEVNIQAQGFKKFVKTNVKVDVATRTTLDVTLEVGAITESITVEASAVQLTQESAQI